MDHSDILAAMRDASFLQGIPEEQLQKLADTAKFIDFPEGKVVFREGEPATRVFLIVHGTVSLEVCAPGVGCRRIVALSEGELIGWSPVLEQTRLTATARTLTATRAIELSGNQILALCEYDPRFGYEIMRRTALTLAKRLSAARMQLLDVFGAETPTEGQQE